VEEVIAATAQEVLIGFSTSEPEAPWGGANFDLSTTTQTVRVWFDNSIEPAPAAPVGGRLIAVGYIGDAYMQADALATALESDAAFTATSLGASVTVTNVTAGLCVAAYVPPTSAYISGYLNTAGANAYQRLSPLNGQELQNIDAVTLDGNPPSFFASAGHQHAYTSILDRPRFHVLTSDVTMNSLTLATFLSIQISSTGTWGFFATGSATSGALTEGFSLAISGPAASFIRMFATVPTNSSGSVISGQVTAYDTKILSTAISPAGPARWMVSGVVTVTSSGTLALRFSNENGTVNVTIQAGAIIQLFKLSS
jgi:hypothetical protein